MGYKIKKGGTINPRYRIILLNNRYFIMDYVNPYKLINYMALFSSGVRTSYPAWEIEEQDLEKLQYKGSEIYLEAPRLFKGAYDPMYEEGLIDEPQIQAKSKSKIDFAHTLGFALVPAIIAIPGLNLPMWARWLFLFTALGFVVLHVIKLLRIPKLETSRYKPVIIGRDGVYKKKMTGPRFFVRTIGFLVSAAIQIGASYAWVTIPLRDFNIFIYFSASLIAWFCLFGYFDLDPRMTETSESDPDKEEMKKYIIVENSDPICNKDSQVNFLACIIVYLLVGIIVYWVLTGLVFLTDYVSGTMLGYLSSAGIALITVLVASLNHDGYNPSKMFSNNLK